MMPCKSASQKFIPLPKALTFPELFATDAADDDMKLLVSRYHHHHHQQQQQQQPPN
jgi:hypothetical protein